MGFQQGLSGLNAASRNLDVIGHNIANANTTGFKSSRAEFADMVASSIGVASGQNNGMGVEVAAVAQQFTQGNITTTGNGMDLAINGNGFFKVKLPSGDSAYTRAGNFQMAIDSQNVGGRKIVTNSGAEVMGYKATNGTLPPSPSGNPVALSFSPTDLKMAPKTTTKITGALNLDARARAAEGVAATAGPPPTAAIASTPASTYGTSVDVYDSQGNAHSVQLYFLRDESQTPAVWRVYDNLNTAQTDLAASSPGAPSYTNAIGNIQFDANGAYDPASNGGAPLQITVTPPGGGSPNPTPPFTMDLDFTKSTEYGSAFSISSLQQDGNADGNLTSMNIDDKGIISFSYSNGKTQQMAQVALSTFDNPQGLRPLGGNNWAETPQSGQANISVAGSPGKGTLRSGALEDSNVDLTAELVGMMTAQRSYQANAQTIKTQDQVLSTIVNLR